MIETNVVLICIVLNLILIKININTEYNFTKYFNIIDKKRVKLNNIII